MKIVPTERLEWPPPYREATEKYSFQVSLAPDGTLKNYLAGQPFPLLDPNDPEIAHKVIWNFSFRPSFTDDFDLRDVEVDSYPAGSSSAEPAEPGVVSKCGSRPLTIARITPLSSLVARPSSCSDRRDSLRRSRRLDTKGGSLVYAGSLDQRFEPVGCRPAFTGRAATRKQ